MVTIPQTGETMTEGEFGARYPRGLDVPRAWFGQGAPTGDAAA